MRNNEFKVCPFRVGKETHLSLTVEGESYTQEYFMPCVKEDCPAFCLIKNGYGEKLERCTRCK